MKKYFQRCAQHLNWVLSNKIAVGDVYAGTHLDHLLQLGIRAIICILPELPLPLSTYRDKGIDVLWLPLKDEPSVQIGVYFPKTYEFIQYHLKHGHGVLIHCKAGRSRSVSIALAYLMKNQHWSLDEAMSWLQKHRPCEMVNQGFVDQLKEWEKKL